MSYPPKYFAAPDDADRAVECLRSIGFWHLAGADGCLCGSIKIFAFTINVNCRKSSTPNRVTVSARHLWVSDEHLKKVAEEVKRQVLLQKEPEPQIFIEKA